MKAIDVCLTHQQLKKYNHIGKIVVIIDVLRASSTINTILYNGAEFVKPIETLEECKKFKDEGYIIMAERMGKKVEGFDYGNSPTKIKNNQFFERKVAIVTSNGTKAILKTKKSKISLIGSFLNMGMIIDYINKEKKDTLLLCSGWKGSRNLEDTLCAGGIISGLKNFKINSDTGLIAKELYESSKDNILESMMKSSHAKRLSSYNNITDIKFCSEKNSQPIIPFLKDENLILLTP